MANKDLTIVLKTKNMLSAGFSQAQSSVKGFSDRLKGTFDLAAKPILVVGAGVMALKKGIDFAEEGFRGFGRAIREAQTERAKENFDRLKDSLAKLQSQYASGQAVIASNNKVFDEQKKSVRALLDATTELEKAKRLSVAGSEEERKAIESEYQARDIATKSAQAQQDIIDDVARKRKQAADEEAQATKLEIASRELGKKSVEALARAADMARQEAGLSGSFLGFVSGANAKELESLGKAKDEAVNLAKAYKQEQEKVNQDVAKLRLSATENIRVSAETEKTIEAERIKAQADTLNQERKLAEERVKLEEEKAKKLEELKDKEADIQKNANAEQANMQKDAWEKQKADNEKIAQLRIAEFIAQKDGAKEVENEKKAETKRFEQLEANRKRGTKLSKRDSEFVDAFKTIKDAGVQAEVAKNNLEEARRQEQVKKLGEIQKLLEANLGEQLKLSQLG